MGYQYEACDERVAFLDPSDSFFLFADFVDFYTRWTSFGDLSKGNFSYWAEIKGRMCGKRMDMVKTECPRNQAVGAEQKSNLETKF
jgi:hypothetical protein